MHFRIEYVLRDLNFEKGDTYEFLDPGEPTNGSSNPTKVTIWTPRDQEVKLGWGQAVATVQTEEEITPKVRLQFDVNQRDPAIKDIIRRVEERFLDSLLRILAALRWRRGSAGEFNPIVSTQLVHWSDDEKDWKTTPKKDVEVEIVFTASRMDKGIQDVVNTMLASGKTEPLGHELFQEAWTQRRTVPRSSLLIGVTAAEVGFKAFVSDLVPDAEWLAMNIPSPPLTRMLEEYLPMLPVRRTFGSVRPFVPKKVIDTLKTGVLLRNKTAHAEATFSYETLRRVLWVIHDLLYLLDFYAGYEWAVASIGAETRRLIQDELDKLKTK